MRRVEVPGIEAYDHELRFGVLAQKIPEVWLDESVSGDAVATWEFPNYFGWASLPGEFSPKVDMEKLSPLRRQSRRSWRASAAAVPASDRRRPATAGRGHPRT